MNTAAQSRGAGALLLLALLLPASALAEGTWALCRFSARGVASTDAATFRELLQSELGQRVRGGLIAVDDACTDTVSAQAVAADVGADRVAYGALSTLGRKIAVTVTVVDARGRVAASDRMTVDTVEDLEHVATRMAEALVTGRRLGETARLGTVTRVEQRAPRRRHGDSGLAFKVGGTAPLGDSHANLDFGMHFDIAYWFEATDFSIEPRLGVAFDTDDDESRRFWRLMFDVGAHWIAGLGDFAPYLGGGVGARFIHDKRPVVVSSGSVLVGTSQAIGEESKWGLGGFVRGGILLFRTWSVRMTVSVEYDVTFVDIHDTGFPHTFTFLAGVIF